MTDRAFSGARVVARGGAVVERTFSGDADRAAGVRWGARTRTQVSSISKQYVAVVALRLAEQGVLSLDDPVGSLLPDCPEQWDDATLRTLLTHTSGTGHWSEAPGFDPTLPLAPADRLRCFLEAPFAYPTGAGWRYSSPGYVVLAAALEAAAGRAYPALVREHVVEALRLTDTTVGEEGGDRAARGYRGADPVATLPMHVVPGTGDVWSSADDVARVLTALHAGGLLADGTRLHEDVVPIDQPAGARITQDGYCRGHFHGTVDGEPAYLHPGDNPGFQSLAAWLPGPGVLVLALSNDESDDVEAVVADLARVT